MNVPEMYITNFYLNPAIAKQYSSQAQKIRVMSEMWVSENLYCPCCGNSCLFHQGNNKPVCDFICERCGEQFELKSCNGHIKKSISNGAYSTMIDRIIGLSNPHLLLLSYSDDLSVQDIIFIPKFFFTPNIIKKRKQLSDTAKRHGWIGCNILVGDVPDQCKISIIQNKQEIALTRIIDEYNIIKGLQLSKIDNRGWLLDVLNCINALKKDYFTLSDIYEFVPKLKSIHQNNNNIEAKIRQQLQLLRNSGIIEFLGRGNYRRLV